MEFLEARYPEVLDKLRRLVRRGQVELMVTYYPDQVYLAYPSTIWRSPRNSLGRYWRGMG